MFVANSGQDTITVINALTRTIIGHVNLRNSLVQRSRTAPPFPAARPGRDAGQQASSTSRASCRSPRPGGEQGDDDGKEGLVCRARHQHQHRPTSPTTSRRRSITLAPQITGFNVRRDRPRRHRHLGVPQPAAEHRHPRQPGLPAEHRRLAHRPAAFNLDTHAFVNVIGGVNSTTPDRRWARSTCTSARATPSRARRQLFFANPWAIAFTTQAARATPTRSPPAATCWSSSTSTRPAR